MYEVQTLQFAALQTHFSTRLSHWYFNKLRRGTYWDDPELVEFFHSTPELSKPRIWVNFTLDTIFLLPNSKPWGDHNDNIAFLIAISLYCSRIKKLALVRSWSDIELKAVPLKLRRERRRNYPNRWEGMFMNELNHFDGCEEMTLYTVSGSGTDPEKDLNDLQLAEEVTDQIKISRCVYSEPGHWYFCVNQGAVPTVRISKEMICIREEDGGNHQYQLKWRVPPIEHQQALATDRAI